MLRPFLILLALTALPALADEEVVAGLSQSRISISTNFDGSEILIFGAVKRQSVPPEGDIGLLIAVEGPSRRLVVREKERQYGIWMNADSVEVDEAPTFYAVATSGPWREVIRDVEDLRHKISIRRAIRAVGVGIAGVGEFTDALIRIRERSGLYQTQIGAVNISEETLFDTRIRLPANLTEGDYRVRFYLTRNGAVIDRHEETIPVQKVGLERFLFRLAQEKPLVYGILSLTIAIAAGWGASAAFRLIRN